MKAATIGGGVAGTLAAFTDVPWPCICGLIALVHVIGSAQQLADAYNTLMHGINERRALRAVEPATALAYYLSKPPSSDQPTDLPNDPLPPLRP
jgi:hypothetical protein